ncbi:MAG: tRNA 2-thiouridine(34) synthase MnmA [Chloroflexi bacterium]|nr:tRNA 2-thiouridine(34) synthase MnmA [Chloroflexota bacterium]
MKTSGVVAVALSGGVDSAVAAWILRKQGARVIGVTMRLTDGADPSAAQRSAEALDIPLQVLDWRERFEEAIIAPFYVSYATGLTPNPCVWCNERVKYGWLMQAAEQLGAERLATGHYARVMQSADGAVLYQAEDARQDQSYFLSRVPRAQLERVVLPLGALSKAEVRALAIRAGLPAASERDSQDICFVGADGYRAELARRYPQALAPGPIVDQSGRQLGEHRGLGWYTLGQREGLGIAASEPLYVMALDAAHNRLVVGTRAQAQTNRVRVSALNWLVPVAPAAPFSAEARVRYRAPAVKARLVPHGNGYLDITFKDAQLPAAPGQTAAFYEGTRLLGSGTIVAE